MDAVIATESLTKRYGRRRGIESLTFWVRRGEVFGFLGPNGAGKTTTIRTLLDFMRPTSGTASVLGLDSHRDRVAIHRRTGYLPGEFAAYEPLTGAEYLRFIASLRGGVERRYVASLAERLDCDLTVRISALSHGNRQKLGLIQAFMHRPEVIVLDEPTQGLDPLVQQQFHEMIREAKLGDQTVLLSSHVLPEVERTCDRVAIIREGSLVVVEGVGDLKARAVRAVDIHFATPVPADVFDGVGGVGDLEITGDVLRCTVSGSMDALVKTAARFEVIDFASTDPGLEDVFLSYYGRAEAGAEPAEPSTVKEPG